MVDTKLNPELISSCKERKKICNGCPLFKTNKLCTCAEKFENIPFNILIDLFQTEIDSVVRRK